MSACDHCGAVWDEAHEHGECGVRLATREILANHTPRGATRAMSIDRTYYCEGPECQVHTSTASPPPYLPHGIIETREGRDNGDERHHFCSWDCAMKFAAEQPVAERIEWEGPQ